MRVLQLQAVYRAHPEKFISAAEDGKLVPGCHPCSLYSRKFAANLEAKARKMDNFGTNFLAMRMMMHALIV